jgi:Zn-dependent M16 (insulinase) family peptidase
MKTLHTGDKLHGFTLTGIEEQSEYRGKGYRLRHDVTGLDLYHLHCEDSENLFAFTFKTAPTDNTGLPHIMEHSVLSGSRRYPVKDPFLALMRGSMNTFLNAMTYPDKTVYPVASPVRQDYFNLMSVYGDAVFFPTLSEDVFRQEGFRIEKDDEGNYRPTGIVFNEMKGAYSNHDSIVGEWSYRSLFPDTAYSHDSGGEPTSMVRLTYDDFREFHKKAYHPSNCRVFLYGDIETGDQLEFLQTNFLSGFTRGEETPAIPDQPRWQEPRRFSFTSPVDDEGEEESKSSIVLSWIVGDITDPDEVLALEVLSEILLGHVGSPLFKAVVDSEIGEDLSPVSGLETDLKELIFALGVRGSDPSRVDDFERFADDTLRRFVEDGLPAEAVEGALKRVEFREREIKGGYPFGLRLMGKALRGWLHGEAPGGTLGFTAPMERLKERAAADSRFFEELIRTRLLENSHRAAVVVTPDKEHDLRIEKQLEEYTAGTISALGPEGIEELEEKNRRLRLFQDAPDAPEALASIPTLSLSDVPRKVDRIEPREGSLGGIRAFLNDFYTNGILYTDFVFDLEGLGREERIYLPLLTHLILHTALPDVSYDQVAHRLFGETGGLYSFLESSPVIGAAPGSAPGYRSYLVFRLKALEENAPAALELARSILLEGILTDTRRLKEVLLEMRNDFASGVVPSGNSVATVRAAAALSPSLANDELWRGATQLIFLDKLVRRGTEGLEEAAAMLEKVRKRLFGRKRMLCNITADVSFSERAAELAGACITSFPGGEPGAGGDSSAGDPPEQAAGHSAAVTGEALIVPSSVNFVAAVMPAARIDAEAHAHQLLLAQLLKTTFLWERIRMRGGAYGAGAFANGLEGLFGFSSYRDPNILTTIAAFREALELMADGSIPPQELEKAVITLVGKETRPQSPGEKSMIGFRRILYGVSDGMRQRKRDAMLATSPGAIALAAASLLSAFSSASVVVVGSESAIKKAAAQKSGFDPVKTRLPV